MDIIKVGERLSSSSSSGALMPSSQNPMTIVRWVTRAAAVAVIAYQIWWSLQPTCPIRNLAEIAASMAAGDDAAVPPRQIPLREIVVPYLVVYWGLLGLGGLCILFPTVMGRMMVENETNDGMGERRSSRRRHGAEPIAWLAGWGIVFILPGLLIACVEFQPGGRPHPPPPPLEREILRK